MPSQLINQDGRQYRFTPGKNGSLYDTKIYPQKQIPEPKPVSKVVPILKSMRKKYVDVGAARG